MINWINSCKFVGVRFKKYFLMGVIKPWATGALFKIMEPKCIGDGVYIKHDGYHFIIYTSDGVTESNHIYLDSSTLYDLYLQIGKFISERTIVRK